MDRLTKWIFIFSLTFTFFILAPPFLNASFPAFPLMSWADFIDIFTPLVLLPIYWLLFRYADQRSPLLPLSLVFIALAAVWAEGQGMHLSANSIGNIIDLPEGSDIFKLTYFYDEKLSHFLWHIGIMGLSVLLLFRQWRGYTPSHSTDWRLVLPASLLYGFTYAAAVLEGGTVLLGIPFAIMLTLYVLVQGRGRTRVQPLTSFFFASYLLASILFLIWCILCRGCPEPLSGTCKPF